MNKDPVILKGIELYSRKKSPHVYECYLRNMDVITDHFQSLPSSPLINDINGIWEDIGRRENLEKQDTDLLRNISSAAMLLTVFDSYGIHPVGSADIRMILYLSIKLIRTLAELRKVGSGMENTDVKIQFTKMGDVPAGGENLLPPHDDLAALPSCLFTALELFIKLHTGDPDGNEFALMLETLISGKFSPITLSMAVSFLSNAEDVILDYDAEFEKFIAEKSLFPESTI